MKRKSGLMPKTILLFFFCISLFGCKFKYTTYSPDEGEDSFVWFDKDSTKGAGFYIKVLDDVSGVTATTAIIIESGELGYYKFIDIDFAGLKQDTTLIDVSLTGKDNNQIFHIATSNWGFVLQQLRAIENMNDAGPLTLICERQYTLSPLPDRLQLRYRIATQDTLVTGSTSFIAEVSETRGAIRWH